MNRKTLVLGGTKIGGFTIAAFIVGIIVAIVRAIIGFDQGTGMLVSTLGGFLIGLLIGMWVVKIILNKKYSDFRIALVSID